VHGLPYEFLTVVELEPSADEVRVVMTVDRMHDDEWTQRAGNGPGERTRQGKVIDRKRAA
jgi:hypothetical protein